MIFNVPKSRRAAAILQVARFSLPYETRLAKQVQTMLMKQAKAAAAAYAQSGNQSDALTAVAQYAKQMRLMMLAHYQLFGKAMGKQVLDAMGLRFAPAIEVRVDEEGSAFSVFEENLITWAKEQAGSKIKAVTATTQKKVAQSIAAGMVEGLSASEIAHAILGEVPGLPGISKISAYERSRLIAITETHNAATFSADAVMRSAQIRVLKEWATAEDDRVRPDHAEVDRQRLPMDQPFTVGGSQMMRPGDGPVNQTARCRCILLYHTDSNAALPNEKVISSEPGLGFLDYF